jgi:hypothetical protein
VTLAQESSDHGRCRGIGGFTVEGLFGVRQPHKKGRRPVPLGAASLWAVISPDLALAERFCSIASWRVPPKIVLVNVLAVIQVKIGRGGARRDRAGPRSVRANKASRHVG